MFKLPLNFWLVFKADLIVRTAYQMGKTPLLPLFAASLGAGQMAIGTIVAISTVTGTALEPLIGALSDRWGRRLWFVAALILFSTVPFLYHLVTTPDQLLALRLFHGLATAIFGPVTLAFVAEMDRAQRATRLGWFGVAREASYLLAPTAAGALLTVMPPQDVFTIIGLLSCGAFLPALFTRFEPAAAQAAPRGRPNALRQLVSGLRHTATRFEMWLAGTLEMTVYCVTYAVRTFLPIFAIQQAGLGILVAGMFFTTQEAAHLASRPVGGWLADRIGTLPTIAAGMALIAGAVAMLPNASASHGLLLLAAIGGIGQGLILPSTVALVGSSLASSGHMGLGMGVFGTLRNLGKVVGPIVAGVLLQFQSFATLFQALGLFLIGVAACVVAIHRRGRQAAPQRR